MLLATRPQRSKGTIAKRRHVPVRISTALLVRSAGGFGKMLMKAAVQYIINAGYDPLLETPDGRKRKPAAGYERPLIGATTNFVGNHMTQVCLATYDADVSRNLSCLCSSAQQLRREVITHDNDSALREVKTAQLLTAQMMLSLLKSFLDICVGCMPGLC